MNALRGFFENGGPFMYVISGVAVIALGTIIERAYRVYFQYSINGTAFMAQVQKLIMADNIDRAIKLCNAESSSALARVIKAGLRNSNRGPMEIQNAIDEASLEVIPEVEKRTPYLNMWANVSTLLGLLGTIQGLIQAFKAVAAASAAEKQEMLAKGISMAMYTTMYGLMCAIPIMVAASFIQNKTSKIVKDIDLHSVRTINLLTARHRGTMTEDES
jgi:biopolymer transport protein ExbB/TolQ